ALLPYLAIGSGGSRAPRRTRSIGGPGSRRSSACADRRFCSRPATTRASRYEVDAMSEPALDPVACAAVIVIAMSAGGIAHAGWMRSRWSARLRVPLDAGLTWRGRRLLGDHKTVRGMVMLPLAAGAAFAL